MDAIRFVRDVEKYLEVFLWTLKIGVARLNLSLQQALLSSADLVSINGGGLPSMSVCSKSVGV